MEDYFLSNRKVHEQRSRVMRVSVAVQGQGHQGHRLEWLDRCMCRQNQIHLLLEDGGITSGWVWRERGERGRGWGNWVQGWEEWGGESGEGERKSGGPQYPGSQVRTKRLHHCVGHMQLLSCREGPPQLLLELSC